MATSIYFIGQSGEEDRPMVLTPKDPQDGLNEAAMMNYRIARLKPDSPITAWTPWKDLICAVPGNSPPSEWDYFFFHGTAGCVSRRALDLLYPYIQTCFVPLPSTLDGGITYFFLIAKKTIDCLNIAECVPPFPNAINQITKYKFYLDKVEDPQVFTIPQRPYYLYCTETIPKTVRDAGLKGFDFVVLDSVP